ncbi:MAG: ABC transporter permease, partial [Pseudarcicella sp.]|nr:ABC transporter permease [Pseudarcicella sp.]
MFFVIKQIIESMLFAWHSILSNKFRTLLSLLGVTIGIFSIVCILTAVDSLDKNIRKQLDSFGSNVLYLGKWPWEFKEDYPWWKYINRPTTKYNDFKFLEKKLKNHQAIAIIQNIGEVLVENNKNSIKAKLQGCSSQYNSIADLPLKKGRFFVSNEADAGRKVIIIGSEIANSLFPNENSLGKYIQLKGDKYQVIGEIIHKGEDPIDLGGSPDYQVYIPYVCMKKTFPDDNFNADIAIKGSDDSQKFKALEGEIIAIMRSRHSLKPMEENDFSVNKADGLNDFLVGIFFGLYLSGSIITGLSLLVGGIGIANIMFVSVSERINIIGIQKSLG